MMDDDEANVDFIFERELPLRDCPIQPERQRLPLCHVIPSSGKSKLWSIHGL